MSRVAFVNMGAYHDSMGRKSHCCEPVQLVPMANICQKYGKVKIFQNTRRNHRSIRWFGPDVIAASFIGHNKEDRDDLHALLQSYPYKKRPKLIVGGPDVHDYPSFYRQEFAGYYQIGSPGFLPFMVVTGPGESLMSAFAPVDFDFLNDMAFRALGRNGFLVDNGVIIVDPPPVPLAEHDFTRSSTDFSLYRGIAQMKAGRGCWGSCVFCAAADRVEYRSIPSIIAELNQLSKMWVRRIAMAMPNFTANPARSSEIVAVVSKHEMELTFASRVDSLYAAINRQPEVWRAFRDNRERHFVQLGVERFNPAALGRPDRLGKYRTQKQADLQPQRLDYIFEFFKGSNTILGLFLIPFDWQSTLSEVKAEFEKVKYYLETYWQNIEIWPPLLCNILHYTPGSRLARIMKPADFYNFERDPRALFLAVLLGSQIRNLYAPEEETRIILTENMKTANLLRFVFACLPIIEQIPEDKFDIAPIVKMVREGNGDHHAILAEFYSQLGFEEGDYLSALFEQKFAEAFPGL